MEKIQNQTLDAERALYGRRDLQVEDCSFDGPADGESALKECRHIVADRCFFNLRYPFWHDEDLCIRNSRMSPLCRAALWYSRRIVMENCQLEGIKALRECSEVRMESCHVDSPEFGWSVHHMIMNDCDVKSEYFMMRSTHLLFRDVKLNGKYSFQYVEDSVFEGCIFDTKDALWHTKNCVCRNCVLKGEYLAWYSENLVLDHCTIIGTQPLCYCKNLTLIECVMEEADLCFEKSTVYADIASPVLSIKNPAGGRIRVQEAGELILEEPWMRQLIDVKM